jgi:hypothetical protein
MAQEFGDHPEVAAERMHWVRQLLACALAPSQAKVPAVAGGRSRLMTSHHYL